MSEALIQRLLAKPLDKRDLPTPTHYTLEVVAYWQEDLLDSARAGRKRKLVVGGYHANKRADLQVELPESIRRFTLARIREKEALVSLPRETTAVAVARDRIELDVPLERGSKHEKGRYRLTFGERIAFSLGPLTFLVQFVHRDGKPRTAYDWLLPRRFAGEP